MDKTIFPPTDDKHDYLSISRYWWPDPTKEQGLPWMRKDGVTNPQTQTDAVDRKRLGLMGNGVWTLSLAYYFTDDERYAQKAISMIETWFLDPDTRMNPHLEYAQSVPGNPNKRATGILDGRSIVRFIPDAVNILSTSTYWKDTYETNMTIWFTDYLNWLTKSDLGIKGSKQKNNHGSWYKFQVASLALYLDDKALVQKMVLSAQNSLDDMLDNQGGQIHELSRSRSYFYSCFNLQALVNIASLGDKIGMDMWQYESDNKKSIPLAIQYLTPVVYGEKWPHKTLKTIDISALAPIVLQSYKKQKSDAHKQLLLDIIEKLDGNKQNNKMSEFWLLSQIN